MSPVLEVFLFFFSCFLFASTVYWTPGLPKCLSHPCVTVYISILWGEGGKNSNSATLMLSPSRWTCFLIGIHSLPWPFPSPMLQKAFQGCQLILPSLQPPLSPQQLVPESPDLWASQSSLCSFPCHGGKDLSNCIVTACLGFNLSPAKSYLCPPPAHERPAPRTPTSGICETLCPVVTLGMALGQS